MEVYFDDLDPLSILHNVRYLLLFERTIGSFWGVLGLGALQFREEHLHVVRTNHVDYHRPFHGTGRVRVRVWVKRLGRTSMVFACRIMSIKEDVDYATASRVVVCIDPKTWEPTPWNNTFRELVAPYVEAD